MSTETYPLRASIDGLLMGVPEPIHGERWVQDAIVALREAARCISDGHRWIPVGERLPADEQNVIGYWPKVGIIAPFFESVTYYAADAPDGPEAWRNGWGDDTDPPDYWMPQNALPEATR